MWLKINMRTSELQHCWLQAENNLYSACYKGAKSGIRYPSSHVSFLGECLQESKPRYWVHKCFDKPDWSLVKLTDLIQFYGQISIVCPMKPQCCCLFWWLFPALMACWQLIDGLKLLLKDPVVAVLAALQKMLWCCCHGVLDCNAIDLIGMAHL